MPTDLPALLPEVQALAARRGWTALITRLAALAAPPTALQIVLAPGTAWTADLPACPAEAQTTLPAVLAEPLPVICAARVVLALPSGRLLTAAEIRWLQQVLLNRPPASYAILLTGVEVIETETDLEAVERVARGALLATDAGHPLLAEHQIYLWGQEAAPWLHARIARDQAALEAWWQSTPADPESLLAYRTGYGLEAALDTARHATAPAASAAPDLSRLFSPLEELRLQMLERWQSATAQSERQLELLLATLEQSLLLGWGPAMRRAPELRRRRPLTPEALSQLVSHYITTAIQGWESRFTECSQGQAPAILLTITEGIESRADWALVNRLLGTSAAPYFGVFLTLAVPDVVLTAPRPGSVLPPLDVSPPPTLPGAAAQMALGGGAAALATGLLTANVPLAVLTGGATAGAIGAAQSSDSPAARQQAYEQFGRQLIQQAVQAMRAAAQQQLHASATALQRQLEAEWTALLTALRKARQAADSAAVQHDADLERLTTLYADFIATSRPSKAGDV